MHEKPVPETAVFRSIPPVVVHGRSRAVCLAHEKKAAIVALEGRNRPDVISLLLSRIEEPENELSEEYKERGDEIKAVAINSIGMQGQNDCGLLFLCLI